MCLQARALRLPEGCQARLAEACRALASTAAVQLIAWGRLPPLHLQVPVCRIEGGPKGLSHFQSRKCGISCPRAPRKGEVEERERC